MEVLHDILLHFRSGDVEDALKKSKSLYVPSLHFFRRLLKKGSSSPLHCI